MPPIIESRVCPELVKFYIEQKANGRERLTIHNKDIVRLLLPTDVPWNGKPVPNSAITLSLRLLRSAEKYPPDGWRAEEIPCYRGMAVEFTREGVRVSG